MSYAFTWIDCLDLKAPFYPLVIPKFPFQPLLIRKGGLLLLLLLFLLLLPRDVAVGTADPARAELSEGLPWSPPSQLAMTTMIGGVFYWGFSLCCPTVHVS